MREIILVQGQFRQEDYLALSWLNIEEYDKINH